MNQKKRYTEEFKQGAVQLVVEQHYTQTAAAARLGINVKNLNRWIRERQQSPEGSVSKLPRSAEQEELLALRKENKQLRMEREILKKAAAFFASESA